MDSTTASGLNIPSEVKNTWNNEVNRKRISTDSSEAESHGKNKVPHLQIESETVWKELTCIAKCLIGRADGDDHKEINDILMVLSNDPDRMKSFECDYGFENVEIAIRKTIKLLHPNGIVDQSLTNYLCCKRDKLMTSSSYISTISHLMKQPCYEWLLITRISTDLFKLNVFHVPEFQQYSVRLEAQKSELLVLMAVDPDFLLKKEISREIGLPICEIGVLQCKHMLERVLKLHKNLKAEFKLRRNEKIMQHGTEFLKGTTTNYNDTFDRLRNIVIERWKFESEQQTKALTVLFMMEPKMVYSKFLLNTEDFSNNVLAIIENKIKNCMDLRNEKKPNNIIGHNKTFIDTKYPSIPVIVQLKCTKPRKDRLMKCLRQQLDYESNGILEFKDYFITCSNSLAFEWLKATISVENKSKGAPIDIAPMQLVGPKLLKVRLVSQVKLNNSFNTLMESIKKHYANLHTELWKLVRSVDRYLMDIRIDTHSIIELEQLKRCIRVDGIVFKFSIQYTD